MFLMRRGIFFFLETGMLIYTLMQIIGILFCRAYENHLQTDGDKQMAGCSHLVEIYFNLYA